MNVVLTGATGFIGSARPGRASKQHGHQVTAVVRDDAQSDAISSRGARPAVVDLHDRPAVVGLLRNADGAIHTASPGDATSADLDTAVVDAAIEAFAGTGKPYLHISGRVDLRRRHSGITEESPINAPALVVVEGADRAPGARRRRHARSRDRLRAPRTATEGEAIPGLLLGSPARRRRQPDHARQRTTSTGRPSMSPIWPTCSGARWRRGPARGRYVSRAMATTRRSPS